MPAAKKPKDYSKTKNYAAVRAELIKTISAREVLDPLTLDRIDEYMDLWCQRQMLSDDIRKRGATVVDERGRQSENRSISLGIQTSKQMLELYKAMGLQIEPPRETSAKRGSATPMDGEDEDDDL